MRAWLWWLACAVLAWRAAAALAQSTDSADNKGGGGRPSAVADPREWLNDGAALQHGATNPPNNIRIQGVNRNEQLLAVLANRRRHIIESRFRNHLKTIVELAKHGNNASRARDGVRPASTDPPDTTSISAHLRLSADVVTAASEMNTTATLKHAEEEQQQEEESAANKSSALKTAVPVIRNILFRRKMSFLNRKLPVDFDSDTYDAIGKNGEELVSDAEDSLQVEESSHDKLIYYDAKNNYTKNSMNNFDDVAEEIKTTSMNRNETVHGKEQHNVSIKEETSSRKPAKEGKGTRNNTHFMSQSVYNHFRPPEDVPLEEMQPFLRFGDKIPTKLPKNQSAKIIPKDNTTQKNQEQEIDEHMDVGVTKSTYENKITKAPIINQKSTIVQQYIKNRSYNITKSLVEKNTTRSSEKSNLSAPRIRNSSRNRGFRNRTIFFHQKRNGMRQTINLNPNTSIANLKPAVTGNVETEESQNGGKRSGISDKSEQLATKALPLKMKEEHTSVKPNVTMTTVSTERTTKSVSVVPTTNMLPTDVVTSISISSSVSGKNGSTSVPDRSVISQLNNFTSQSFSKTMNRQLGTTGNGSEIERAVPVFYLNKTDFIIHVPESETTNPINKKDRQITTEQVTGELPLATLFNVIDLSKNEQPEPVNSTRAIIIGSETVISRKKSPSGTASFDNVHAAYILACLGLIPMLVITIYVARGFVRRKNKCFDTELQDDKTNFITAVARQSDTSPPPSKWEFPRSKLRLQTLLGQGNFGQVWKAEADDLKGHVGLTRLVAVKTIKNDASEKDRQDLLKELAIMQKMGSHPNVVTLLGCCTDKEPCLVIMEYVMYGKLLTYLRDHRTRRDYFNFSDDAATLTSRDLTVFAYCVARGMEYLASIGIIHRDLAARNVLVDHNKLCKIADFGMSRVAEAAGGEVREVRAPRNALPVRWMAVESLLYNVFTSASDVWSFGVLLWEIVTLGSSPYANTGGREVMRLVCRGRRLERPRHCRPELFGLMEASWREDSRSRPTFAELRARLHDMLATPPDGDTAASYVDLESFRQDPTCYEIDNCTPRGNYFVVNNNNAAATANTSATCRFSEFECDI